MNLPRPLLLCASIGTFACGAAPHEHHTRFQDPEEWSQSWDDPARDAWQRPEAVIRHLKLSSDSTVADIGAGTGYFAVRLSPEVPVGKIYAIDIEPAMVQFAVGRAKAAGLTNVEGVVASSDDPNLPVAVEAMLMVNTYHHIADQRASGLSAYGDRTAPPAGRPAGDREDYFRRLHTKLKPGGRFVIVDYRPDASIPGPPLAMRLAPEAVIEEMTAAGWKLAARSDAALPRQYILMFE